MLDIIESPTGLFDLRPYIGPGYQLPMMAEKRKNVQHDR